MEIPIKSSPLSYHLLPLSANCSQRQPFLPIPSPICCMKKIRFRNLQFSSPQPIVSSSSCLFYTKVKSPSNQTVNLQTPYIASSCCYSDTPSHPFSSRKAAICTLIPLHQNEIAPPESFHFNFPSLAANLIPLFLSFFYQDTFHTSLRQDLSTTYLLSPNPLLFASSSLVFSPFPRCLYLFTSTDCPLHRVKHGLTDLTIFPSQLSGNLLL